MAFFNSDQLTNLEQTTPVVKLKPAELMGRVRVAYFTYTTPATGAPAIGDIVNMTKLPANSRALYLGLVWGALSTGVAIAGADWGVADDAAGTNISADFQTALNMDAAGSLNITPLVLDKIPNSTLYANIKYVVARVTGEAWATSTKVQGFVMYVLD